MDNAIIFQLHVLFICLVSLLMLRIGERALNAWLCILAIAMNLFVTKQINLGWFHVTAADSIAGCYLLGLCLLQENFGRKSAYTHVLLAFACCVAFLGLSYFHLWYTPAPFDSYHEIHRRTLECVPRLVIASLTSFLLIQVVDIFVFQYLREYFSGRFFILRTFLTLLLSNTLDTFIFSFLGLYGMVENIWHIIAFSLVVKFVCVAAASTYGGLSKWIKFFHPRSDIEFNSIIYRRYSKPEKAKDTS